MNSRTLSNIDKCIEELTLYTTIKVSQTYKPDGKCGKWDKELTELVHSVTDLIKIRRQIEQETRQVEIPEFLNK